MSHNTNPVLWIDGKPSKLLTPQQGAKRVYWGLASKQGRRFGVSIPADLLPLGLNTKFSIGTEDNPGVNIAMLSDATDGTIVRGSGEFEWGGETKVGQVYLHHIEKDNTFQLRPSVTKKAERTAPVKKVLTAADVFTSKV